MQFSSQRLTLKKWVLFTTYGWFIGILLVVAFAVVGEWLINMNDDSASQAIVGIGMGAGVGFMHWMAIRKYLASSSGMFFFSTIGFSFAFIIRDLVVGLLNIQIKAEITIPFAVLLGALISAWLQYTFLLKKIFDKAVGWISYSTIGWLLATLATMGSAILSFKTANNFPKVFLVPFVLIILTIGGPILGYITGWFIVRRINDFIERNKTNTQQHEISIGISVNNGS